MTTGQILLLLGAGGAVLYFATRNTDGGRTNNPAQAGSIYVPPQQSIPTYGGRPSPSAAGASAWGLIPPTPTDAQQAAQVISAIGQVGDSVAKIVGAFSDNG